MGVSRRGARATIYWCARSNANLRSVDPRCWVLVPMKSDPEFKLESPGKVSNKV